MIKKAQTKDFNAMTESEFEDFLKNASDEEINSWIGTLSFKNRIKLRIDNIFGLRAKNYWVRKYMVSFLFIVVMIISFILMTKNGVFNNINQGLDYSSGATYEEMYNSRHLFNMTQFIITISVFSILAIPGSLVAPMILPLLAQFTKHPEERHPFLDPFNKAENIESKNTYSTGFNTEKMGFVETGTKQTIVGKGMFFFKLLYSIVYFWAWWIWVVLSRLFGIFIFIPLYIFSVKKKHI